MAYIGQGIKNGTFTVLDTSGNTYNGSNVTFSLGTQVGSAAQLLVSHDGVIQKPGTDYTLATGGTQITFTTAPASGASIFIVEISGAVGGPINGDLDGAELVLDTDGDTSITADTDDQIDIKIAGADDFQFTANQFLVQTGSKIDINGTEFILDADADTSITADTDDQIDIRIAGADDFQFTANTFTAQSGSTITTPTLGVISAHDLGAGIHIKTADSGASALADADELVIESDADVGISILQHTGGNGTIAFGDSGDNNIGMLQYYHGSVNCFAITANATESVRIKDDRVGIGTGANVDDARLHIETPDQQCLKLQRPGTSNSGHCVIVNDNGTVGEISSNGSTTTYATSSDYRLKENVNYTFDATTRLKQLKPARFNWIADDTNTLLDGFLAHEVSSIVPEAVNKSKDATKTLTNVVLDANGKVLNNKISEDEWKEEKEKGTYPANSTWQSSKSVPDYQTIDESKLVPLLVKTIQELEARVKTLEDA